jgi:hypothetical protein
MDQQTALEIDNELLKAQAKILQEQLDIAVQIARDAQLVARLAVDVLKDLKNGR